MKPHRCLLLVFNLKSSFTISHCKQRFQSQRFEWLNGSEGHCEPNVTFFTSGISMVRLNRMALHSVQMQKEPAVFVFFFLQKLSVTHQLFYYHSEWMQVLVTVVVTAVSLYTTFQGNCILTKSWCLLITSRNRIQRSVLFIISNHST